MSDAKTLSWSHEQRDPWRQWRDSFSSAPFRRPRTSTAIEHNLLEWNQKESLIEGLAQSTSNRNLALSRSCSILQRRLRGPAHTLC
jgi:hypothetical protein